MFNKEIDKKEIIRISVNFLKSSERFVLPFFNEQHLYLLFVFIYHFYLFISNSLISYCAALTVYILYISTNGKYQFSKVSGLKFQSSKFNIYAN